MRLSRKRKALYKSLMYEFGDCSCWRRELHYKRTRDGNSGSWWTHTSPHCIDNPRVNDYRHPPRSKWARLQAKFGDEDTYMLWALHDWIFR